MNKKYLAIAAIAGIVFLTGIIFVLKIYTNKVTEKKTSENISEVETDKIEIVSEEEKWAKYIDDLTKSAMAGDAKAQYELGWRYYNGICVERDKEKSLYWLQKSVDQDYADALFELGMFYYMGRDVEKNFEKAFEYLQKAAKKNHIGATYQLGRCYFEGTGVKKNIGEALKLYKIAADQGDVYAQYSLGLEFFEGKHLTRNYSNAIKYLKSAADQWHAEASYYMGLCYENGWGVEKNPIEAIHYYRTAGDDTKDAKEKVNAYKIKNIEKYLQGVEFIYQPAVDGKDKDGFITRVKPNAIVFVKNGKVLSRVESDNNLRFMEELYASRKHNKRRVTLDYQDLEDKNFDYRTMLHDIHGNLDYRYLFIGDFHTGNSPYGHEAYIIDVKNNFQLLAKIEAGEIMDYPYYMEHLTSWETVLYLGYFGANGSASIDFMVIYKDGKKEIQVPEKIELTKEEITNKLSKLKVVFDRNVNWYTEAAITFLYEDLIQTGNLNLGPELALKIGYTREQADKFHAEVLEKIRNSKYSQELAKLNDIKL